MPDTIVENLHNLADKMLGKEKTGVSAPYDDMQAVLDAQAKLGAQPIETLTPDVARKQPTPADGVAVVLREKGKDPTDPMGVETSDIEYDGAAGKLAARVYKPEGADASEHLPVVLYFHGGGFVIANIDVYDASPRAIAKMAKAIVVSAEYRQAPEHKFPGAHDDAFAAYQWLLANVESLGGDPTRIAIMGESAGGGLALATSVKARDLGLQAPVRQVLVYPVAGVDMETESYRLYANAKPLNKAMMAWFVGHYLNDDGDKADPRIDAIGLADLSNLPDTTIVNAEIDPLCSDGELLAAKLERAGVNVNRRVFDGATHEFFGMGAVVGEAKHAEDMVASDLKSSF